MGHSSLMVQLEYDRVKRNADVPHPDLTRPKIVYKKKRKYSETKFKHNTWANANRIHQEL